MSEENHNVDDIDKLLSGVFNPVRQQQGNIFRSKFENRLAELHITTNQALENLQIESRTLNGILDGTLKRIDVSALVKIAEFLEVPENRIFDMFYESHKNTYRGELIHSKKRAFIHNNFDLKNLKKSKFLEDTTNLEDVEQRIVDFFGFDSIFDYKADMIQPAFSSGARKAKNGLMRDFWVEAANINLKKINNPYDYDRKAVMEYFPTIRWNSMNVEKGLFHVARSLFKLGITLIYQPYLPTLYVRGATFSVNNKPCIVITDYNPYYASLWFALIHELYHVLFDWDEIRVNAYHMSGEPDLFIMKETEADDFAREYLFSKEKMEAVKPHIKDKHFIEKHARENHIHPSIIYTFYCHDQNPEDKMVWSKFSRLMPDIRNCLASLVDNPWQNPKPIKEIVKSRKSEIFNIV